ncbi:MAG: hypothetical protein C4339_02735 [Nitrososphaerota archaeon]
MRPRMSKRRAVSPVIATVILIAITLIAAVAIAGFVFGLFSGFTSTPQVTVVQAVLRAADFSSGRSLDATCATAPSGSYLLLRNSGTSNVSVIAVTLGGVTADADPATCTVPAGGQLYIQLSGSLNPPPTPGSQFSGIVSLSNGAQVPFSGTFR